MNPATCSFAIDTTSAQRPANGEAVYPLLSIRPVSEIMARAKLDEGRGVRTVLTNMPAGFRVVGTIKSRGTGDDTTLIAPVEAPAGTCGKVATAPYRAPFICGLDAGHDGEHHG